MNETENKSADGETRVLSDSERRSFQGVTIDEGGGKTGGEDSYFGDMSYEEQFGQSHSGQDGFRVYTLSSMSFLKKLFLGGALLLILFVIFFFSSIYLIGFAVLAFIGALWAVFKNLFK